jgi:hypothetical protein
MFKDDKVETIPEMLFIFFAIYGVIMFVINVVVFLNG